MYATRLPPGAQTGFAPCPSRLDRLPSRPTTYTDRIGPRNMSPVYASRRPSGDQVGDRASTATRRNRVPFDRITKMLPTWQPAQNPANAICFPSGENARPKVGSGCIPAGVRRRAFAPVLEAMKRPASAPWYLTKRIRLRSGEYTPGGAPCGQTSTMRREAPFSRTEKIARRRRFGARSVVKAIRPWSASGSAEAVSAPQARQMAAVAAARRRTAIARSLGPRCDDDARNLQRNRNSGSVCSRRAPGGVASTA